MSTRNFVLRLVFFVLLLMVPTALIAQEALTQTYTSADGMITMSYPEGWTVEEEDGLINFISDRANLQVNYRNYGEEVTPLEVLEIGTPTILGFSEPEDLDIAGYAAVLSRSSDQLHIVINFCEGNLGLAIGFTQSGEMATFEPTFRAMMESLRFGEGEPVICRGAFEGLAPMTLANAARVAQLTTLGDETVAVESVAFNEDGSQLAIGDADGNVQLWSMVTGEEQRVLEGHSGGATSVAFGGGGYLLAVGTGSGRVRLWHTDSGDSGGFMQEHNTGVESVAFMDPFLVASGSLDGEVRLWDIASRAEGPTLVDNSNGTPVQSVAFSPDGATLAAGGGNTIRLWDVATGTVQATLETEIGDIASLSFRPDGTMLVYGGADPTAWVWDLANDNRALLEGHTDQVFALAFSPDGTMIASGDAGTVRLWDVTTGANLVELPSPSGQAVNSVAFSPDGTLLASGGESGGAVLWGTSGAGGQEGAATEGTGETTATTTTEETTPGTTTSASTCTLTAPGNVNLRSGPGTDFDRAGSLSGGQTAEVDAQTTGTDGMTWYRLTDGTWVRSDVVGSPAECAGVPVVTA